MKRYLSPLLLAGLFIYSFSFGQESGVKTNRQGKGTEGLKHSWKAQWVTHPTASTLDYGVFLFRKNFSLQKVPESFTVYVSADNRYRLFVNGKYVCSGPSRGDLLHWRYETLDLAPYLKNGQNVIAAEVVNFGEFRPAKQITFQTAFILQGSRDLPVNIDTRMKNGWKVMRNEAFSDIPFVSDSVGAYYAAGPGDLVDGSKYPWGWQRTDFDDTQWPSPRLAMVEFAAGYGFLYGSTWFLVPRTIPMMEERITRFRKIARTENIHNPSPFISGSQPLTIPPDSKVSILLDHGVHTIGYPELLLSGGRGAEVRITYAEGLFIGKKAESPTYTWRKGNRNETEGLEIRGYYDIIKTDGGRHRLYKPLGMRTFRYVQLDITTGKEPLTIDDYYNVYTAYPFEEKAFFHADDKWLDKIWDVAWRTTRNSSTEGYEDPYYEQLQYVGDTRIEALVSTIVSGDDRLMRKAISQFDDSRLPMGLTQSRYPSYIVQVIPPYSLIWIDMMHDFLMYRDGPEFLRQFLPGIESVLGWFERHIDETGMLGPLEWWNFTDWADGFANGTPPGADDGHSANISLQYALALKNAADIFNHFGLKNKAGQYRNRAKSLNEQVLKHCYDAQRKLIAERPEKDVFSQHTNTFAILAGAIAPDRQKELMKRILTEKDLIKASLYFRFYIHRAMLKSGLADEYLRRLQPWKNMINEGLTTFGEKDENPRSDCHGWSASPCFDFLNLTAGIRSVSPGFSEVLIEPHFGHLKEIKASLPHPAGTLMVEFVKDKKGKVKGNITLPPGVTGRFQFKDQNLMLKAGNNEIR